MANIYCGQNLLIENADGCADRVRHFFGVRKLLMTLFGGFSAIYFRGLGLRITVRPIVGRSG